MESTLPNIREFCKCPSHKTLKHCIISDELPLCKDKISLTNGNYMKHEDYKVDRAVSNEVVVATDVKSGYQHIIKKIPFEDWKSVEVQLLIDLNGIGSPFLYHITIDEDENIPETVKEGKTRPQSQSIRTSKNITFINIHMEYLDPAITWNEMTERYHQNTYAKDNGRRLKSFVLFSLKSLLTLGQSLWQKGWVHADLHEENVMVLQTETGLKLYLIDFGEATSSPSANDKTDDITSILKLVFALEVPKALEYASFGFKSFEKLARSLTEERKLELAYIIDIFKNIYEGTYQEQDIMDTVTTLISEQDSIHKDMKEIADIVFKTDFSRGGKPTKTPPGNTELKVTAVHSPPTNEMRQHKGR